MIRSCLVAAALLAAVPAQHAAAQSYKFKTVKYGMGMQTGLADINASGTIVGGFFPAPADVRACFVLAGTKKTVLSDPKAKGGTECWGINTAGTIVGDYIDSSNTYHGYIYTKGKFTTIDPTGSTKTVIYGINDTDVVIGYYTDSTGASHGFTYDGKTYTTIDIKGGSSTEGFGINNAGHYTVSTVLTSDSLEHSYLFVGTKKTELVFKGYPQVAAHHLNNSDQVVATLIDANGVFHGGVYDGVKDAYYVIDFPKAGLTVMDGINDKETLVGRYQVSTSSASLGYVATGKLP